MYDDVEKRIETFEQLMPMSISGAFIKRLFDMGFFTAPASTKYHGNYEGGLFEHSVNVTEALVELTNALRLKWSRAESPYIIGMFHDLCKSDQYEHPKTSVYANGEPMLGEEWVYRKDTLLNGHGDKSIMLLSQFFTLTEEEILCIRYHMGAFVDREEWNDYTRAIHRYPNVLWAHTADMMAAHIKEV